MPLLRRLQQRRQLRGIPIHGIKGRVQMLCQRQGGEARGDGRGGGERPEFGAGE